VVGGSRQGLLRRLYADGGFPGAGGSGRLCSAKILREKREPSLRRCAKGRGREKTKNQSLLPTESMAKTENGGSTASFGVQSRDPGDVSGDVL
jgi:hypothetical protein